MSRRQHAECADEIRNLCIGGVDADTSAELLQHVDACPSVRCVHHEMYRSLRFKHAAQSAEACIRVGEMMENTGANNLIEARPQVVYSLDRELVDVKIFQVVFSLEFFRVRHTGCATVDAGTLSRGPAQRVLGRLRCSASGDEDGLIFCIGSGGPK